MEHEIAIDGSGRIVIPKDVRVRHRLVAGTRMVLLEEDDRMVLVPVSERAAIVERGGLLVFEGRLNGSEFDHRGDREARLERLARR
jgi:AbrB family looped-hinge helix DNA binding protein